MLSLLTNIWPICLKQSIHHLDIWMTYLMLIIEPAHDKPYNNKTCVTSKDSDQHVHTPSMPMVLVHSS